MQNRETLLGRRRNLSAMLKVRRKMLRAMEAQGPYMAGHKALVKEIQELVDEREIVNLQLGGE